MPGNSSGNQGGTAKQQSRPFVDGDFFYFHRKLPCYEMKTLREDRSLEILVLGTRSVDEPCRNEKKEIESDE